MAGMEREKDECHGMSRLPHPSLCTQGLNPYRTSAHFRSDASGKRRVSMRFYAVLLLCLCFSLSFPLSAQPPANDLTAGITLRALPCRLLDTRHIGGQNLGEKIDSIRFLTWNNPGSSQGGESGCGVPAGTAGILINLTVYQPTGAGYVRLYPHGFDAPLSSSSTFASGQLDESSGVIVRTGEDGKIELSSPLATAHFIIDLVGYMDGGGGGNEGFGAPRLVRFLSFSNAPYAPGAVNAGDRLVIAPSGTVGAFVGHENEYVHWNGAAWVFQEPSDGDLAYEAATGTYWRYQALGTANWEALN